MWKDKLQDTLLYPKLSTVAKGLVFYSFPCSPVGGLVGCFDGSVLTVSAVLTDQCSLVGGHVGRSDGSVLAGRRPCRLFRRVSAHWSKAVSAVSPGQCSTVEGRPFRHLSFKPVPTKAPSLCADKRPCKFFPLTYAGHLLKILSA